VSETLTAPSPRKLPLYERWRWQIFAVTWLAYAGFYLTRKSVAVAKIDMSKPEPAGLGLDNQALGLIDGAFLTAYALGQFFWGVCGDRYGTRRVILIGMFGSVIAALAMGASSLVVLLIAFSAFQGICQSSGWAPLSKNLGCFFSQRERGSIMGLWCTNYALGGFIATIFAAYAAQLWGWRFAFYAPAVVLLAIWIVFFFFQRRRSSRTKRPPTSRRARGKWLGKSCAAPWSCCWPPFTSS
jgi:OPA family glycerol-3-phosphate transporter-like MFS transporter